MADKVGIETYDYKLSSDISFEELSNLIEVLNKDSKIDGILVQLPLPSNLDETEVLKRVDPEKDVDGLHPKNIGLLSMGSPRFVPATPFGIKEMLMRSNNDPKGKHVVILGRSNIVGKPLSNLLSLKTQGGDATVTLCHSRTKNLEAITQSADVLVAAIGIPEFITYEMVSDGVVVIDVGVNRVEDKTRERGYRLTGDIAFEEVSQKASAITPVPGGVGPMTIAMLLQNTLDAAYRKI